MRLHSESAQVLYVDKTGDGHASLPSDAGDATLVCDVTAGVAPRQIIETYSGQ